MSKATYSPGNPIELIDTTNMTNERWLEIREHGLGKTPKDPGYIPYTITGSGASSALGVNPWVSDEEYRDKKMGIKPALEVAFNEENKAAGHVFEPFVAINFLRYMKSNFPGTEVKLIKDCMRDILPYLENACPDSSSYKLFIDSQDEVIKEFNKKWSLNPSAMYQCGTLNEDGTLRYPFALANIDGLVEINGKVGIFEAKTTSTKSHAIRDYWEQGKIPPYYYWQLVFYMAVMNVDYAYITCIWGVTLSDMAVVYLERDLTVEEEFMDFLAQFVEDMETGLPLDESKSDPELVSQYYYRLYGPATGSKKEAIELPPYCRKMVKKAIELDREISEAEKTLETLKSKRAGIFNDIHPIMKDNAYATVVMEDKSVYGIKLKPSLKRPRFDEETFKTEHPDLYDEFGVISVDTASLDKKYKGMKKKYTLPAEPNPTGTPSFELFVYSDKAE